MKMQDKVAIVTGSSKGIGAGIARAFAQEGARVVITSSTESEGVRHPIRGVGGARDD